MSSKQYSSYFVIINIYNVITLLVLGLLRDSARRDNSDCIEFFFLKLLLMRLLSDGLARSNDFDGMYDDCRLVSFLRLLGGFGLESSSSISFGSVNCETDWNILAELNLRNIPLMRLLVLEKTPESLERNISLDKLSLLSSF